MNRNPFSAPVDGLLRGGSQMRVLRFLWESRTEWGGREIARRVGLSAPACHEALKNLDAMGLVVFKRISNVHIYRINADNYLVRNVLAPLFKSEKSASGQIEKLIRRYLASGAAREEIVSIALFGSIARNTGGAGSDLDLLVVIRGRSGAKRVEAGIEKLRAALSRQFNMPLSPYVQTLGEFRSKHARNLPLIKKIIEEGRHIFGMEPRKLIT